MDFSHDELRRYARHWILPEVGPAGQEKLRAARVLCLGAGGLGSPVILYLAAAGIGRLGIVDADVVELSNLQRQVLYGTADIGQSKAQLACAAVARLNPHTQVQAYPVRLDATNALEILAGYDLVVDGSDNFPTRYLVNDGCVWLRKPLVYGAIFRFEGQASVFGPHLDAPCYRCLYPEPPPPGTAPDCAEAGVLGVLPGLIGCVQATEAIKLVLGRGTSLLGRLLVLDALQLRFRELRIRRDPDCPVCGRTPRIRSYADAGLAVSCAAAPQGEAMPDEVSVDDLRLALEQPGLGIQVIDVREPHEAALARIRGIPLMPLGALPERLGELDAARSYYFLCKSGVRSMRAVQFLKSRGFHQVKSVRGGLRAWSQQIDPSVPIY